MLLLLLLPLQVPGPDVPPGYDINMITPLGYPNATNLTQPSPR